MANTITNLGLNNSADRDAQAGAPAIRQSMSFDDSVTGINAATTNLGGPANLIVKSTTNTRAGQTVTYQAALGVGDFNGQTVRRFAIHNIVAASVTGASNTVEIGVDGQGIQKNSSFALTVNIQVTYASP